MKRSISITEARTKLPRLIKHAEAGNPVTITRHGSPVAVLVSTATYGRLASGRIPFGVALERFLAAAPENQGIETGEFEGLRARHEHDLAAIDAAATTTNHQSDTLLDLQAWPE